MNSFMKLGGLFALMIALPAFAAKTGPANYTIDTTHTFVMFKTKHLGFSTTFGRFTDVQGNFMIDEMKPANTSIDIEISARSIDTQDAKRDKHLRSPDFFNVKKYPKIMFKSTKVKKKGKNTYAVTGDLTFMGKTKKVTFDFNRGRTGKGPQGKMRTGGDFELTIKRKDWGMKYMLGKDKIPNDVTIVASVEGIVQK